MWTKILDFIEYIIRTILVWFTNCLKAKVIRDERGNPFLYRYHIFAFTKNGPGICIHHFVKSDPDRGFHDHPWDKACSLILAGGYNERILNLHSKKGKQIENHKFDMNDYTTFRRSRFQVNCLNGKNSFHRVMLEPEQDAWTIFFFFKRSKRWGMIDLEGNHKTMSVQVEDTDGGWWNDTKCKKGYELNHRVKHPMPVSVTADVIVRCGSKILLIQRGKEPYKDYWAIPGGRVEQKDIDITRAAKRELLEETNLNVDIDDLQYLKTIGNNTRDPRGFTVTNVYLLNLPSIPNNVKAGDDAINYSWFHINELPTLAFDHNQIIKELSSKLNSEIEIETDDEL